MSASEGGRGRPVRILIDGLPRLDALLRDAGYAAPVDRWQNIADLLLAFAAQGRLSTDPSALRPFLAPLICASPEEQRRFPDLFRRWLQEIGLAPLPEHPRPTLRPVLPRPRRGLHGRIIAGAAVATCALLLFSSPTGPPIQESIPDAPHSDMPESQEQGTPATPAPIWAPGGDDPPPAGELQPWQLSPPGASDYIPPWTPPPDLDFKPRLLPPWREWLEWVARIAPGALAVALLAWLSWGWLRWSAALRGMRGGSAIPGFAFELPAAAGLPWDDDPDLARALRRLHRPMPRGAPYLTFPATVEATARQAGLFQPVYRQRMQATPELLVLLEARYPHDQLVELAELLVERLRAVGFAVRRLEYDQDPTRLIDQDHRAVSLASLVDAQRTGRLLIIGEPARLMGPGGHPRHRLMGLLSAWEQRGLLMTRLPPAQWASALRAAGLPLADFSGSGLRRLAPSLVGEPGDPALTYVCAPPLPQLLRDRERWIGFSPPPAPQRAALRGSLSNYLESDGGDLLLSAMALYPTLHLALTLALDRSLFPDDSPERRERRLLTVARLPWCRVGWIPDWLRQDLIDDLGRTRARHLKRLYQLLLLQARPGRSGSMLRPIPIGIPGAMTANAEHLRRRRAPAPRHWRSGIGAWIARGVEHWKALGDLRVMRALSEPRAPLNDRILGQLLFSKASRVLDLALPRDFARLVPGIRARALIGRLIPTATATVLLLLLMPPLWQGALRPAFEQTLLAWQHAELREQTVRIAAVSDGAELARRLADVLRDEGFLAEFSETPLEERGNVNTVQVGTAVDLPAADLIGARLSALARQMPTQLADLNADGALLRNRPPAGELRVLIRGTGMRPLVIDTVSEPSPVAAKPEPKWVAVTEAPEDTSRPDGSCHDFTFSTAGNDALEIDDTMALRSLRQGAPVYANATGPEVLGGVEFGDLFQPLRRASVSPDEGRLLVRRPGDGWPLGWMERTDLLCRVSPLRTMAGSRIERKAFSMAGPIGADEPAYIRSYPGPATKQCETSESGCRILSRFDLLFVYAEDELNGRLLLSFEQSLQDDEAMLVGWVPTQQTIPWDSRYGLRPADHVDLAWLYPTADAAYRRNAQQRYPVKGNNDGVWYSYPMRLPIIAKEELGGEGFYKVAAPGPTLSRLDDPFGPSGEGAIAALKGVDVLFLIDGTRSMGPTIDAVAQALQTIATEPEILGSGTAGNHYRFGYRIFRDLFADKPPWNCTNGVCEGLALDRSDCGFDPEGTKASATAVAQALNAVTTSNEVKDDFPEALFAGIDQAITDLGGCDDRLKVLIVVGDHGDNGVLSSALERKITTFAGDFLVFFIQSPDPGREKPAPQAQAARLAYNKFQEDAERVLRLVYPGSSLIGFDLAAERAAALRRIETPDRLPNTIYDLIGSHTSSQAINDVLGAIRGGDALDDFLSIHMAQGDMPILFWERVYSKLCDDEDRRLGRRCTDPVERVVGFGYVRMDDDDWIKEIWLDVDDLDAWLRTLRALSGTDAGGSASAQRRAFVDLLLDEINWRIGEPPIPETGETLEQFVQRRSVLPVREHSPLLGYELPVLRQVPPCELRRLQNWADSHSRLLNGIMARPQYKPQFSLTEYPDNCTGISDAGRRIKRMDLASPSTWERLGPDARASYEQSLRGSVRYWLPEEFVP